jgi:hypothetical protein
MIGKIESQITNIIDEIDAVISPENENNNYKSIKIKILPR